jgi:mono/diheme cytochrome c family protein
VSASLTRHCRRLSRRLALLAGVALAGAAAGACEKHEFEPPDRAARVADATQRFQPEMFDTIAWPSDSARAFAGNNTYAAYCRDCHGYIGEGETDYARERGIEVPSLVREDWPYDDLPSMRQSIFTGHPEGMPIWGVAGITPREIDGVAYYILHVLRPEIRARR